MRGLGSGQVTDTVMNHSPTVYDFTIHVHFLKSRHLPEWNREVFNMGWILSPDKPCWSLWSAENKPPEQVQLLIYLVLLYIQWLSAVALVWDNHTPLIWIYQMWHYDIKVLLITLKFPEIKIRVRVVFIVSIYWLTYMFIFIYCLIHVFHRRIYSCIQYWLKQHSTHVSLGCWE